MARRTAIEVDVERKILDLCRSKIGSMAFVSVAAKEICESLQKEKIEFKMEEISDALTQLIRDGKIYVRLYPNPEYVDFVLADC